MSKETKTVSAEITELSALLENRIAIDDEGVLTVEAGAFDDNTPAEIKEHVVPVQEHIAKFNTALLHAASGKALPVMKEKGIKRVSGSVAVGKETTSVNITAPTGRKADGSMKDPVVTVISRRVEHADHATVRQAIYDQYRALAD
ncbi:hypothetical protein SPLA10_PHROGS00095 [Salmonella phage SPLA10]|nr:hypothetical protein SPLA10_PHROGS00095 [Salmonella phage SPLA10]